MEKTQVEKGFDRLSPIYDRLAHLFFGRELFNAQGYFIDGIEEDSSILILGGGTGELLTEIIKSHSFSAITFLDISSGMISKAKEHVRCHHQEQLGKIRFIQGTYECLPELETYHVIITPFVLDCLNERALGNTITALYSRLEYNGQWLFTDFNVPPKPFFIKWLSKGVVLLLYMFFNLFCKLGMHHLPEFSKYFSRLFAQTPDSIYFLWGMVVARRYIKSTT